MYTHITQQNFVQCRVSYLHCTSLSKTNLINLLYTHIIQHACVQYGVSYLHFTLLRTLTWCNIFLLHHNWVFSSRFTAFRTTKWRSDGGEGVEIWGSCGVVVTWRIGVMVLEKCWGVMLMWWILGLMTSLQFSGVVVSCDDKTRG